MLTSTAVNGCVSGAATTVDVLASAVVNRGARGTSAVEIQPPTGIKCSVSGAAAAGDKLTSTVVNYGVCGTAAGTDILATAFINRSSLGEGAFGDKLTRTVVN